MSARGRGTASGSCSAYAAGVGGPLTAVVLNMLVFLCHGVERLGRRSGWTRSALRTRRRHRPVRGRLTSATDQQRLQHMPTGGDS